MLGVLANTMGVIVGTTIGLLLKKAIPDKVFNTLLAAMGLCITFMGIQGALGGTNSLIIIISMAVGTVIGQGLELEERFTGVVGKVEKRLLSKINKKNVVDEEALTDIIDENPEGLTKIKSSEEKADKNKISFAEAFVNSSLLFCVGAMAIVGALNAGLMGDNQVLYTKAVLDIITGAIFGATLGIGVYGAAISVFIYEGTIVLLATYIKPYLTDFMIGEMACVGSLLIIVMGLNMMKITNIKVLNLMPAMFVPIILCMIPFFAH